MKKRTYLVKHVLMSTLTAIAFAFGFTSCADDIETETATAPETALTRSSTDADRDRYNINEDKTVDAKTFDRENWRNVNGIFLRVSNNDYSDKTIVDSRNRTGYMNVTLPWAENEYGSGSSKSNLPEGFCNDIKPENGWSLVANFCGRYDISDAHYFVLYNKYTGKLRYFYYIPEYANTYGSADHNFQVLFQDNAAEHSVFGYAVPAKRNIDKNKRNLIKAETSGFWSQYVTPWTSTGNSLGHQAPQAGWYAFDIDLSVYRGEKKSMSNDKVIKTSLYGYKSDNVSLFGQLKADVSGKINLEKCCASTTSGVFGPMEDLLEKAKNVSDFIDGAKTVYDNITKGDFFGAIEGGINIAKQGCDIVGIDYGAETTGFDGYKGDVNMKFDGTIDMSGTIKSRNVISGLASIEQGMQDFDFGCAGLGEGVWNIEEAPVVYYTNAYLEWACNENTRTFTDWLYYCGTHYDNPYRKSPFGGIVENNFSTAPYGGVVCYFDPSSIKLMLNPNVFSPEEIESAKVYATCGVRKNAKFGSNEVYRDLQGLHSSKVDVKDRLYYGNRPYDDAPFDALSSHKDKMGMKTGAKFGQDDVDGKKYGVFGRGDSDYIVEGQPLYGKGGSDMMPAYEVTVTVIVMHDGKPIVYSRNYLPEYKEMKMQDMPEITGSNIMQNIPAHYIPEVYKQQRAHIRDIYKWSRRTLIPTFGTPSHMIISYAYGDHNDAYDSKKESYANLFDNDLSNRWVSGYDNVRYDKYGKKKVYISGKSVGSGVWKDSPCWYVEFKSHFPISPKNYTLISANDAGKYPQCNPKVWCLYGKKNPKDPWTKLGASSFNNQPGDMLPNASSKPTRELPFRLNGNKCEDMQYFRFEIMYQPGTSNELMRLGEIRFNYDDSEKKESNGQGRFVNLGWVR